MKNAQVNKQQMTLQSNWRHFQNRRLVKMIANRLQLIDVLAANAAMALDCDDARWRKETYDPRDLMQVTSGKSVAHSASCKHSFAYKCTLTVIHLRPSKLINLVTPIEIV